MVRSIRIVGPIAVAGVVFGCHAVNSPSHVASEAPAAGASVDVAPISPEYRTVADRIIRAAQGGNDAYDKLRELCDDVGHRISGSPELEKAVAWAVERMKRDGQENVHTEAVMVPKWVRGTESARMIAPREMDLHMLGLGMSVGTPPEGVTGSVVCVADEQEFEAKSGEMAGKIVLFNNPMPPYDVDAGSGYGNTVRFRGRGPSMASSKGAIACLIRAVTAHSLRSPHTGMTHYDENFPKIPAAAISTEDAAKIARLQAAGKEVQVRLTMDAKDEGMVESANVIAELRGREKPDEVLVLGGHIDSWDVGDGAHDDGGGCIIAMEAINVLRKLDLRPRRTIRVVLWTNEENGLGGGRKYAVDHADELSKHVGAIEADSGAFSPRGLSAENIDESKQKRAAARLRDILSLCSRIAPMKVTEGHSGADVSPMKEAGVTLMGFDVEGSKYFDYHHSWADTFDKVNEKDLTDCVTTMAVAAYVIADMPGRLDD